MKFTLAFLVKPNLMILIMTRKSKNCQAEISQ